MNWIIFVVLKPELFFSLKKNYEELLVQSEFEHDVNVEQLNIPLHSLKGSHAKWSKSYLWSDIQNRGDKLD